MRVEKEIVRGSFCSKINHRNASFQLEKPPRPNGWGDQNRRHTNGKIYFYTIR